MGAGVLVFVSSTLYVAMATSDPFVWPTLIGLAGMVVGLVAMVAIRRGAPEPDTRSWRYRALPFPVRLGSSPDGRRGREIAKAMIIFAASFIPLALFYLVARPGFFGRMFQPRFLGLTNDEASLVVGFGGMVVGLAWMIRIYRADPEPGEPTWRYRS